ncbi:MAG: DNA-binding protein, partial [Glaciimonas sp.]|nr:DNA-binding protein [Glaciimonas sp.]
MLARLDVSRVTLMRQVKALGSDVVVRGAARRTAYAARRAIRGNAASIPLYRIDSEGRGSLVGQLDPLYPEGSAVRFEDKDVFEWPLMDHMADGWFDGLPYFLDDMRPQGFLGRHFARLYSQQFQVPENPVDCQGDDVIFMLSILGADQPGNYLLGGPAYRRFLGKVQQGATFLADADVALAYPQYARDAMESGVSDSSAGGEFPKFTARRLFNQQPQHVLVKFSGNDASPSVQRWSDLLICENLALEAVTTHLHIEAAKSRIYRAEGRTFLEVERFDRHGAFGRSAVLVGRL